jgi:type II secretory ATPase GspE/PulE/Tfp pilus assembly ATPase PilB-like protein
VSELAIDRLVKARSAKLFLEAELISPATFKKVMLGLGVESKSLVQILQQEVSAETLKDLMTMDVNPFGKRKAVRPNELALSGPTGATQNDVNELLLRYKQPPQEFLDYLVECGVVENRWADELATRSDDDEELLRMIVEEQVMTPRVLDRIVRGDARNPRGLVLRVQVASDILLHNDIIGPDDIAEVLELSDQSGEKPYDQLHRVISQDDLGDRILAGLFFPSIELTEESLPPGYADMFPVEFMQRMDFLPLQQEESHFTLAVPDILDLTVADALAALTGKTFSLVETSEESLRTTILAALPDARLRGSDLPEIPEGEVGLILSHEIVAPSSGVSRDDELGSTIDLAKKLLERALEAEATDIHIERVSRGMRARFRTDGILHPGMEIPERHQDSLIARFKVMANMDVTERRRPQDGRFSTTANKQQFDFRLSTLPTQNGEKLVIRVLGTSALSLGLDELGLEPAQRDKALRALDRTHGLILATGPTGSGKTTTLYTMLARLNSIETNIITIEDPVEYKLEGVSQVQVDPNVDLSFANGLRAALRQDPDIIMLGEVRDAETGRIAVRASLTGHLVFSTLHTNSAIGAISALRYLGVQSYLIASSVVLVVAQRLVRRVCPNCRKFVEPDASLLRDLGLAADYSGKFALGAGCQHCYNTGMRGRAGIFESLEFNPELRRAIIEERDEMYLQSVGAEYGLVSLREAALKKVVDGVVSAAEAMKECFLDT